MTTKIFNGSKSSLSNIIFNNPTNIFIISSRFHKIHSRDPTIVGYLNQLLTFIVGIAGNEHLGTIAVISIQIACDIKVDNVAFVEFTVVGYTVTDNFIDGGTARFGEAVIV